MDYSLLSAVVYPQVTAVRHNRGRVRMNKLLRRKVRELLRLQEYRRPMVSPCAIA
ncbi:MAG: hypothetical protein DDT35_00974 [Firmicutes bacterium]|nr:hypothetical protein [Bacillota bacterium]